jgi:cytochrome P450
MYVYNTDIVLMVHATHVFYSMAGFETTAQGVGYAIWQLARHPDIQKSLREEVVSISTFDDYNTKMPLLDAVVKERYVLSPLLYRDQ